MQQYNSTTVQIPKLHRPRLSGGSSADTAWTTNTRRRAGQVHWEEVSVAEASRGAAICRAVIRQLSVMPVSFLKELWQQRSTIGEAQRLVRSFLVGTKLGDTIEDWGSGPPARLDGASF